MTLRGIHRVVRAKSTIIGHAVPGDLGLVAHFIDSEKIRVKWHSTASILNRRIDKFEFVNDHMVIREDTTLGVRYRAQFDPPAIFYTQGNELETFNELLESCAPACVIDGQRVFTPEQWVVELNARLLPPKLAVGDVVQLNTRLYPGIRARDASAAVIATRLNKCYWASAIIAHMTYGRVRFIDSKGDLSITTNHGELRHVPAWMFHRCDQWIQPCTPRGTSVEVNRSVFEFAMAEHETHELLDDAHVAFLGVGLFAPVRDRETGTVYCARICWHSSIVQILTNE
jgi:hypothetical protein